MRRILPAFIMVMIFLIPLSGCVNKTPPAEQIITPADSPELPERGFFMGVLPTPAKGQTFEEAYSQAAEYVEFSPVWGRPTPFYFLASELSGEWGQTFVEGYIRKNGMFPVIHVSFIGPNITLITPPNMKNATLSDPKWREAYKKAVLDVVKISRPLYLSLGNEVNRWYEKYGAKEGDPNGFQHYVSLYEEIYDAVKELSPETKVFCTFAREIVSENREANLEVLSLFNPDKMDLLVFTSYPYAVRGINRPRDIPDDYYSRALKYMPGKPVGLIEIGWPSIEAFGGEQGQTDFILEVTGRLTKEQGVNLHLLGWAWLHDLNENDHLGLITRDGKEKLAYNVWVSISRLGKRAMPTIREDTIPKNAIKIMPEMDVFPPILHSDEWSKPVPLEGPINTAGAEDSPFVTPDGKNLYFFFTPDVNVPPQKQLIDGVTGIWWSKKINGKWSKPMRIVLGSSESLDGAVFILNDTMWFASVRRGNYGEVDIYTAKFRNGRWTDVKNAGELLNAVYDVGELCISPDGKTMYYGCGGDICMMDYVNGSWVNPRKVPNINSELNEDQPFITPDGNELWFTGQSRLGYPGPAIFRSLKTKDGWSEPEEIVSNFAGEPVLDAQGNLYFVHHYVTKDMKIIEADIYVAYKK
ncbi:hypothetical protein PAP_08675 [Palaeococcus pacificus DY20341]|uniref:Uncharacterized protein n=1 Tax=Palaeococcus pacificus DY20341 TaxID=1343739 RepID=A0A075LVG3_9EURY|nr:PD40 domain-containing protein [Palaeococcus pacificus]AIF70116.1 hypothetical protein PAP_08675 [Palaeococcus pacificus DY20341]